MKAIITGAGGFVGANLARRLLAEGHEVIALVRPDGDSWRLSDVAEDVALLTLDLEDADAVERVAVQARPDVMFHLAAHGAYSWQTDLSRMLAVNVLSTQALLQAAVKLDVRLVNAGSSSEYGYKDHPPDESEIARPNSHYAVTKLAGTHLCQLAADRHGAQVATLRLYSIYGPWEEPGRLMPTLVRAARAGHWPPLVGPSTARDFVWIDDACTAFLEAARRDLSEPGTVFNVASGRQTTLAELVDAAADVFGVAAAPEWGGMEQRAWDTSVWVGEPGRAGRELAWRATTDLSTGLARLGAWFGEHPELEERYA